MGKEWYKAAKYGAYITVSYEGPLTDPTDRYAKYAEPNCYSDGHFPTSINELADHFDVEGFVRDMVEMQVEYVNFTLHHAHLYTLCPNKTIEAVLPGHTARRDVIREILDGLHANGIRMQLYIHATIGDSMSDPERDILGYTDWRGRYKKWNDFINTYLDEVCERYPDMDSFYSDMTTDRDFFEMIDQERLYHTLTKRNPDAVILGNGEAVGAVDFGTRENHNMLVIPTQSALMIGRSWWALPNATSANIGYTADELFRMLAILSGANTVGGGVSFGFGPYCDTGFEPGVKETMVELGKKVENVAESIKNTYASSSYVTPAGIRFHQLPYGISATRSVDDKYEYIHVINPPQGNVLHLPEPLDRKKFADPVVLGKEHRDVSMVQDDSGVTITLGDNWLPLDTVIRLTVIGQDIPQPAERFDIDKSTIQVISSDDVAEKDNFQTANAILPNFAALNCRALLDNDPHSVWSAKQTDMERVPELIFTLDRDYELEAMRVLPRQDGTSYDQMTTHIDCYAIYVSTDGEHYRAVASGEMKRSLDEKTLNFPRVRARYVKFTAGPEWIEARVNRRTSIVTAAEMSFEAVR